MKDWPTALSTSSQRASPSGVQPSWLPEARELADACHNLAIRVGNIDPASAADPELKQTEQLLQVIGARLERASPDNQTAALSMDLLRYARALPEASTKLWEADTTGSAADFGRSLPQVSVALMTLSQHVADHGSSIQCSPRPGHRRPKLKV
jgi:hypothetical protein